MDGLRKLDIPADAAKYDAACTSSGTELQDSRNEARPFIVLGDHRPQPHCWSERGLPNGSSRNHSNPGSFFNASIFNARLKVKAMEKEMPKTSWRNLPEARMIGPLIASAARRTGGMIAEATTDPLKGQASLLK